MAPFPEANVYESPGSTEENGYLDRAPHYNSIFKTLEDLALTPILQAHDHGFGCAAAPDRNRASAVDSTGFSTATYKHSFSHKYGRQVKFHPWVKAHVMVGVQTDVRYRESKSPGYTEQVAGSFPQLLETSRKGFGV